MDAKGSHYFHAISARSKVKRTNTIREVPREDRREVKNYLGEEAEVLLETYRGKYCEWFLLLKEGFNLILTGFGSKRLLLSQFAEEWLSDERTLIIPGFFPEITTRTIASSLKNLLDADGTDAQSLRSSAANLSKDVFLVIHSIDRLLSSNSPSLNQLVTSLILSSDGHLHLVASTDHVNAGILWDTKDKNMMNLFCFNCPTYQSFRMEREYLSTFNCKGSKSELNLSSVQHVYDSLTPNAQSMFRVILEHHISNVQKPKDPSPFQKPKDLSPFQKPKDPSPFQKPKGSDSGSETEARKKKRDPSPVQGSDSDSETEARKKRRKRVIEEDTELTFSRLYKMCREKYLVNSEVTLRAQLTEFQDHKILKVAKQGDGVLAVQLLISTPLIAKFLETIN